MAVDMKNSELNKKRKQDQKKLEMIFANESAKELLPYELWCHIVSFVDMAEYKAYFVFLRKHVYYQDTYYMFAGTQKAFKKSIAFLKQEAEEIKRNSRADENELMDTPVDTWCNADHHEDGVVCPDANGHCCFSLWVNYMTGTKEEFNRAYIAIDDFGASAAQFNRREIRDISSL